MLPRMCVISENKLVVHTTMQKGKPHMGKISLEKDVYILDSGPEPCHHHQEGEKESQQLLSQLSFESKLKACSSTFRPPNHNFPTNSKSVQLLCRTILIRQATLYHRCLELGVCCSLLNYHLHQSKFKTKERDRDSIPSSLTNSQSHQIIKLQNPGNMQEIF